MSNIPHNRKVCPATAKAMYEAGYSTREIAGRFGVRPPAITRTLNSVGVKMRHGKAGTAAEQCDRLADLMADGASLMSAAEAMGIGKDWARRLWKEICVGLGAQAI